MALPAVLFGLDHALGSREAEVFRGAGTLEVLSTSEGWAKIFLIAGALFFVVVVIAAWRKGGWQEARSTAGVFGAILGVCIGIMIATSYSELRLTASVDSDVIVIERRGVLLDLWVGRDTVPIADLIGVGIGTSTIKAPLRNGTPQGRDKTAYHLRLRTADWKTYQASSGGVEDMRPAAEAASALLEFLVAHPAREGQRKLTTNLGLKGFPVPEGGAR